MRLLLRAASRFGLAVCFRHIGQGLLTGPNLKYKTARTEKLSATPPRVNEVADAMTEILADRSQVKTTLGPN